MRLSLAADLQQQAVLSVDEAYRFLEVPPGAPMHVIRRAYTRQVVLYHPETAPDGGSSRQIGRVGVTAFYTD